MHAEGPPDAKDLLKINRKSTEIKRRSIANFVSVIPKCRRTLPKIEHELREETLGKLSAGQAISGCGGLALASSIRRTPPVCWRVRLSSVSHRSRRGLPLLTSPPDPARPSNPSGGIGPDVVFSYLFRFGAQNMKEPRIRSRNG